MGKTCTPCSETCCSTLMNGQPVEHINQISGLTTAPTKLPGAEQDTILFEGHAPFDFGTAEENPIYKDLELEDRPEEELEGGIVY